MNFVYGTDANGKTWKVSDGLTWDHAQFEWRRLDSLRRAGYMPHVKHFEVRDEHETGERFVKALVNTTLLRVSLRGRGYGKPEAAARAAWRETFGDRFHERGTPADWKTGVQGRGGWFYYPNGQTAAQGLHGLVALARRMNLYALGVDGRYYVLDARADLDRATVTMLAQREAEARRSEAVAS